MDSTFISGKRHLFAYCITDGALDDMSEEQRTALILDITEIKEEMLRCVPKKKKIIIFFLPVRPSKSLFDMNTRTNWFK